jgi:hypothetical protein
MHRHLPRGGGEFTDPPCTPIPSSIRPTTLVVFSAEGHFFVTYSYYYMECKRLFRAARLC